MFLKINLNVYLIYIFGLAEKHIQKIPNWLYSFIDIGYSKEDWEEDILMKFAQ